MLYSIAIVYWPYKKHMNFRVGVLRREYGQTSGRVRVRTEIGQ